MDRIARAPREIEKVPNPHRNRLMATLGCDLALDLADLLQQGRRSQWSNEVELPLLWRFGGANYRMLLEDEATIGREMLELEEEREELERLTYTLADEKPSAEEGVVQGESVRGYTVWWRYDRSSREEIDSARKRISLVMQNQARLDERSSMVLDRLWVCRSEIRAEPEFQEEARRRKWIRPDILFGSALLTQNTRALYYLRNTDPDWYRSFEKFALQGVQGCDVGKWLWLRNPDNVAAIEAQNTYGKLDLAAAVVLKAHANGPSPECSDLASDGEKGVREMKSLRQTLRRHDTESMGWLKKLGSTSNPYITWFRRRDPARWAAVEPTDQNGVSIPLRRDAVMRYNELYWCLSRAQPKLFPFSPIFDAVRDREECIRHMEEWWACIRALQLGQVNQGWQKEFVYQPTETGQVLDDSTTAGGCSSYQGPPSPPALASEANEATKDDPSLK